MENSTNKIALVTGGSRGLGKDMAIRLADYGNDVIITYHSQKKAADEVVEIIEEKGRKAKALQLDTEDLGSFDDFIINMTGTLKSHWNKGKFDFLINNAGVGATIPFVQVTEQDFDRLLNIHFKGIYFLTQKALAIMNDGGRIINISSGTTRYSFPGYSIYASMKGAIEVFTRYLAKEIGGRRITANVVAPGAIETDFNNAALRNSPERQALISSQTALGRTGKPEDIGGIVAFLCTDDAGWINGQRIEATGGINL